MSNWVIGVDFDNTLVCYDRLICQVAVQRGIAIPDGVRSKRQIRDAIRRRLDGETEWQRIQALVYGPRLNEAVLNEGVGDFFTRCRHAGARVYIVSHKTPYAAYDETRTDLREAALSWMEDHRFFDRSGLGLSREDVYFEGTRGEKIERIRRLGCTHFIDDLEETFREESFPTHIAKVLYAPDPPSPFPPGVKVFSAWKEVRDYFFDSR